MHQALIRAGIKGVGAHRGHRAFGGHSCMANAVGALHQRHIKPLSNAFRETDIFVNLDVIACAHHSDAGMRLAHSGAYLVDLVLRNFKNRMAVFALQSQRLSKGCFEICLQSGKVLIRMCRLDGDFGAILGSLAIDGDPCAIGPAIRHCDEHIREHAPQRSFQRGVF